MKEEKQRLKNETKSKNKKVKTFISAWDALFDNLIKTSKLEKK
jgi:hypothetical protein